MSLALGGLGPMIFAFSWVLTAAPATAPPTGLRTFSLVVTAAPTTSRATTSRANIGHRVVIVASLPVERDTNLIINGQIKAS